MFRDSSSEVLMIDEPFPRFNTSRAAICVATNRYKIITMEIKIFLVLFTIH